MKLSVEGSDVTGYWVNLGSGQMRLGDVYTTAAEAGAHLDYHARTCGVHTCIVVRGQRLPVSPPRLYQGSRRRWRRLR